jgi:tetratricopeptide (TPR) repeat protein
MAKNADALFKQAQEKLSIGKLADAELICDQALTAEPRHALANHMRGTLHLARGNPTSALPLLQLSADLGNDHTLLPFRLGLAHVGTGNPENAIEHFSRAIELNPELPDAAYNLGLVLLAVERTVESLEAFQQAEHLSPGNAAIQGARGSALVELNRFEDAIIQLDLALATEPDSPILLNAKSRALDGLGYSLQALEVLWQAYEAASDNQDVITNLANALRKQGNDQIAIDGLRKIIGRHSDNAHVVATMAICLERANQCEEAVELAFKARKLEPTSFLAAMALARSSRRADQHSQALNRLDEVCTFPLTDFQRSIALRERGQVLDRLGQYDAAFTDFTTANQIDSGLITQDRCGTSIFKRIADATQWIEHRKAGPTIQRTLPSGRHLDASHSPVFFIGFPRSGTTLLDMMLKSHPRIISAGERAWVLMAMRETGFLNPQQCISMTEQNAVAARRVYWNLARRAHGDRVDECRLLDKMPLNVINLAFINRIFPNAKILMAIRDPRDCVLSAFMQNFARTPELSPFLTLESGARYYVEIMNLWQGYQEVLQLDSLEFTYEKLVSHTRVTLEKILFHIGEPWDDAVLQHDRHLTFDDAIKTPSARDVTNQVYSRAIHRWHNYAEHIRPIQPLLKPFVDTFSY